MRALSIAGVVAVGLSGLAFAGCGGGDAGPPSDPETPGEWIDAASLEGVNSGEVELALEIDSQGKEEEVNMRLVGPFLTREDQDLPAFDLALESHGTLAGRTAEFFSGLLFRQNLAVANYEGQTYQPDETTLEGLETAFEQALGEGVAGDVEACGEAAASAELDGLVRKPKSEGRSKDIDGKAVTWISADLDVSALIDALGQISEASSCGAQLEALAPHVVDALVANEAELVETTAKAQVLFAVDKNNVLKDVSVDWVIRPAHPKGEQLEVEFDGRLLRVNEITELPTTHGYTPFASLLRRFGLDLSDVREADAEEALLAFLDVIGEELTGRGGTGG